MFSQFPTNQSRTRFRLGVICFTELNDLMMHGCNSLFIIFIFVWGFCEYLILRRICQKNTLTLPFGRYEIDHYRGFVDETHSLKIHQIYSDLMFNILPILSSSTRAMWVGEGMADSNVMSNSGSCPFSSRVQTPGEHRQRKMFATC